MSIKKEKELYLENKEIAFIKLTNKRGLEVHLTNYGATILSILIPDKNNNKKDITLGYKNIQELIENHKYPEKYYFGCTIGRYANRISRGKFQLDNKSFQLTKNEGDNHLHGGFSGLNKKAWNYSLNPDTNEVLFSYDSIDGDEGYPGNLYIKLSVSLNDSGEIILDYKAVTDKPTPVNLTNHLYFNLNGGISNILDHMIELKSKSIVETNNQNIPTGLLQNIKNSDYDLNTPKKLKTLKVMQNSGFDTCFVLDKKDKELKLIASLSEPDNNTSIGMYTTEPSVQCYTANGFDGSFTGKNNIVYYKFHGICLEAQNFPDSPNHSNFPNSILYPGEVYKQTTIYKIIY